MSNGAMVEKGGTARQLSDAIISLEPDAIGGAIAPGA
jgi:hypothetical protein